jgi:poly-gamma-glutamate synthesis protein (capsule biosynthesis protein)
VATETPTAAPQNIWYDPALPEELAGSLKSRSEIQPVDSPSEQTIRVAVNSDSITSRWVYALVAPFDTITDEVTGQDLKTAWSQGDSSEFPAKKLIVSQNTYTVFSKLWGTPATSFVSEANPESLVDQAWQEKNTWAIIPFDQAEARWKVIVVDGQSPLRKDFQIDQYPLVIPISVTGPESAVRSYLENFGPDSSVKAIPASNRDPSKLTTVIVTGVTAMVRGTAAMMVVKGIDYPAENIADTLRDADITHVSNEIPFTPKCPQSYSASTGLVFCTNPKDIGLMEDIGTDVVELTGDHFQDWGSDAMLYTLDMYKQRNWPYYGGGANLDDAIKPALFDVNGNKIAFLGCNGKAPGYAVASDTRPGAVHCHMDVMADKIKELRSQGYQVIFTFQHEEVWTYKADPALIPDFEAAADAGATIVSGSQAHQPQAIEFRNGAFVHYGLGNLFFDQYYEGLPNRQAFIDRHVFYNGKYLGTELLTIMFVDWAQSRFMTTDERSDLLSTIFKASNW